MKIVNGKIEEATRDEMYDYYLTREWYMVMSFRDWLRRCEEAGTKVTDDEEETMPMNDCRWLDRYFGTVCRNMKTHPNVMHLDDGTTVLCEPSCKRCEGCDYEPITPNTPAWDDDGEDGQ